MRQLKITPLITNRNRTIELYFTEVEKEGMISPEEEIDLARRIKLGDKKAEDKLTKANLRFVISVSKKYANRGIPLEDLIGEGNIGLIKAARKFDETRGFKFISYAVWWIRQSILESFGTHMRSIRIPLNVQGMNEKIRRFSNEFEQHHERIPSAEEICLEFGLTDAAYFKLTSYSGKEYSLDSKPNDDSEETFADLTPSGVIDAYEIMDSEDMSSGIEEAMDMCLNDIEKNILRLFYGIGIERKEGLSNDEIGKIYHLTGERVRQIREKALKKLRHNKQCLSIMRSL